MKKTVKNDIPQHTGIQDGEVFELAGIEFIKFPSKDGQTPIVAKNVLFRSAFGKNTDFRKSQDLKKLESDVLPKIISAIGEDALCSFKTDFTTLDGLKPYGVMESRISIPTLDFYRENVEIFDKHKLDAWWWLATPFSAKPHYDSECVLCVSPSGSVSYDCCDGDYSGVRPFLILKSSIFESSEV